MSSTTEDTWLTIADAAEKLGIHPRTLRRYIREGKLDQVELARQVVRIRPDELTRFTTDYIRIETGTGGCYVRRQVQPKVAARAAKAASPRI